MDDLEYTTRLGGYIAAHQLLIVDLYKKLDLGPGHIDALTDRYRTLVAAKDALAGHTSDMHWAGFQAAMDEVRKALAQKQPG
ncbi:TPA: hypothetical protein ACOFD0_001292 [Stenotrophomonas maltophilia]|uniref:hypothetical protein n=1 Tax=Stenotrophomonas TaxID=40323 RepID=UPI000B51AD49|nr:hypothetical protein [Stenotrophomonas maltophilia]ASE54768.1 hypothetical protein CEQ03_19820 [Stenotrophomonas maltophilia]MCO7478775.1 hypothetical protein [Stenotrophomonas maltophilia]MCO7500350.1 hypothetical protein [Stenotrophomonas maltophilia]QGM11126.1 hypothetical protein FEO84_18080 [Stenotrophomonas maltophilia]QNG72890.1 hypothetical protein EIELFIGP_01699 [Stenotrophomonas maltophilia]